VTTTLERRTQVEELLRSAVAWAGQRDDVEALALVGSWARGDGRMDSDVDLIVLSTDPATYVEGTDWIEDFVDAELIATRDWGAITERRLRLPTGLEIEVGVGSSDWAMTDPIDPGTRKVVQEGFRVLHDPQGVLAALAAACGVPA
jgi:predicted nucleotidyltransferase